MNPKNMKHHECRSTTEEGFALMVFADVETTAMLSDWCQTIGIASFGMNENVNHMQQRCGYDLTIRGQFEQLKLLAGVVKVFMNASSNPLFELRLLSYARRFDNWNKRPSQHNSLESLEYIYEKSGFLKPPPF